MMPIPTHLKDCVIPDDCIVDKKPLAGAVRCPCGGEAFEMVFPGHTHQWRGEMIPCTSQIGGEFFFRIEADCQNCARTHLLLDIDFHGWGGFVCHDRAKAALPRPLLEPWRCPQCTGTVFTARVEVQGDGKEVVLDQTEGAIDEERWPDAFGWLTIDIACVGCGHKPRTWVSCKT